MLPALACQVIAVSEGIVPQNLRLSWDANTGEGRGADALIRKPGELLRTRWDTNDGISIQAESAGESLGMLLSQRMRVKPMRASFTIKGEKVWTHVPPPR